MSAVTAATSKGKVRRVIVAGGGLSGLAAVLELARQGVPVLHLCSSAPRRSPSTTNQEGIEAALGAERAAFEAHRSALRAACAPQIPDAALDYLVAQAPNLVGELATLGVPFNRESSGSYALSGGVGSSRPQAVFAGATTGQQVVVALERQLLAMMSRELRDERGALLGGETLIDRREGWDLVGLVRDDQGVVVGAIAFESRSGRLSTLVADAICLATGGAAGLFETAGTFAASGAALGAAIEAGAVTVGLGRSRREALCLDTVPRRPLGTLLLGMGAKLWSCSTAASANGAAEVSESERSYFSQEALSSVASLAEKVSRLSEDAQSVFLDCSRLPAELVAERAAWTEELCRTYAGAELSAQPVRVVAAASGVAGGLWVDLDVDTKGSLVEGSPRNQATSLPGLYAAGDVEWLCRGAGVAPGNRIAAGLLAGRLAAKSMVAYRAALQSSAFGLPHSVFERALAAFESDLPSSRTQSAEDDGANGVEVQFRLSELVQGLAQGTSEFDKSRKALGALNKEARAAMPSDPVVQQSVLRRCSMHWRGLFALSRALVDSFKLAHGGDGDAQAEQGLLLGRMEGETLRRITDFEYESVGRRVSVKADASGVLVSGDAQAGTEAS